MAKCLCLAKGIPHCTTRGQLGDWGGDFKLNKVDVMILLLKNSEHHFPRKGSPRCQLLVILHLQVFEVSLPKTAHTPPAGSSILLLILSTYSTAFSFHLVSVAY